MVKCIPKCRKKQTRKHKLKHKLTKTQITLLMLKAFCLSMISVSVSRYLGRYRIKVIILVL